jgi:hypothetical protein
MLLNTQSFKEKNSNKDKKMWFNVISLPVQRQRALVVVYEQQNSCDVNHVDCSLKRK